MKQNYLMISKHLNRFDVSWHKSDQAYGTGVGVYDSLEKAVQSAEHLAGLIHKRPHVKDRPPVLIDTRDAPRSAPPVYQCVRCDCGALVPPDRINCPSCEALI